MLEFTAVLAAGFALGWIARGVIHRRALLSVQESWQRRMDELRSSLEHTNGEQERPQDALPDE